jgi:hypothetical protein
MGDVVGLIYDTEVANPNALNFSNQKEIWDVYAPDMIQETYVLLKVLLLGRLVDDHGDQDIPSTTIAAGTDVVALLPEEVRDFHLTSDGSVQLKYINNLSVHKTSLLQLISRQLEGSLSDYHMRVIRAIERNLLWEKSVMA